MTEAEKHIRWGIIGCGRIAHEFAQDLQKVAHCSLYGVASRTQEKAKGFGTYYGAQVAYDSYEALVNDGNIDAIYIATPHVFHKDHTLLALEHGKPVLCEKPFAMNKKEVSAMIACAKEQEVLLMEALWTAFLPHFQYVLKLVQNKNLGELLQLDANFSFVPPLNFEDRVLKKELGGGALMDIGIYPVFAALSSLGVPDAIQAKASFFDNGADSECEMLFEYPGAKANLSCTLVKQKKTEARFIFEQGELLIHSMFHQPTGITLTTSTGENSIDFGYTSLGFSYEIDHFNNLLRQQKLESDVMSHDFSLKLIQLLDEVKSKIGLVYS